MTSFKVTDIGRVEFSSEAQSSRMLLGAQPSLERLLRKNQAVTTLNLWPLVLAIP